MPDKLGIQDKTIQRILRHANIATAMNIYVKAVDRDQIEAMEALERTVQPNVQPQPRVSARVM